MAFSTDRLKDDNLLIKEIDALEKCGMLNDIFTGKTGVLTKSEMNVEQFYAGGSNHAARKAEVNQDLIQRIESVIILDSNARLDINDEKLKYEPAGNEVEVAMLNFLFDNDTDVPAKLQFKNLH
jgi:magnesium-transporting ATPase (P-type)